MAHKKAGGSTALGRESQSKRLGVKIQDGQIVQPGMIIVRQRGTKFKPGLNVKVGHDDTIYASASGKVKFTTKKLPRFDGKMKWKKVVSVLPLK